MGKYFQAVLYTGEKAFDLSCLPEDNEKILGIPKIVQFGNESFTKFLALITVRKLNENFLAFFKEETGN